MHLKDLLSKFKPNIPFSKIKPYYLGLLGFFILVSIYHVVFANRIIPGVTVAGLDLGGLTYEEAVANLLLKEQTLDDKIIITRDQEMYTLNFDDIDLEYNWEAAVTRAFEVGRTGNLFSDTKDKLVGPLKTLYIPTYYDFDEDAFNSFLLSVRGDIDSPAEDAAFSIDGSSVIVDLETTGYRIDQQKLYEDIIDALDKFSFSSIEVNINTDDPEFTRSELLPHIEKANEIIFSPLTVVYKEQKWELSPEKKLEFLKYSKSEQDLAFNEAKFKGYLETISPNVNELPRGTVQTNDEGKVISFELKEPGQEIDVDKTTDSFKDAYFGIADSSEIFVNDIDSAIDPKEYGILELIGEGTSLFSGSAQGRINNLTLAAERTNGVLVPPGSIYSMNDSIGEISAATGYDAAWIILGSRTVLGHGGGVCQTSTTLFRAVLDSGLPIVARHPHAYRVRYYELGSPMGIDASIYQPTLDFQFKNDTPNYVLVTADWDLEEQSLTFRLYGTPDGREVEITEPVVTSQSPPPEPLYQDDPTLAKGVVRQVDFPAWGARVSFDRTVTRDGEVLYEDTFKTNYQPWRAVYLVGTKD